LAAHRSTRIHSQSLSDDADILIYGCDLASSENGRLIVSDIATHTGGDVAASIDTTGHKSHNADWDLEYHHGDVESPVALSAEAQSEWSGSLPLTNSPTNLTSGIEINTGVGNDAFLQTTDASAILGGLSEVTVEFSFAAAADGNHQFLFTYSVGAGADALAARINFWGSLDFEINGSSTTFNGIDYTEILDNELHHLAISWDNSTGAVAIFVDGELTETKTGFSTNVLIDSNPVNSFTLGQDTDGPSGGYDSNQIFRGTLHDFRIWSEARSAQEISYNYQHKIDPANLPANLVANWQMDSLSGPGNDTVIDIVAGRNLTVGHATGAGFFGNVPVSDLHISEQSNNGTSVGFVTPGDPDYTTDLIRDGLFSEAATATTTRYTAGQVFGDWEVTSGTLVDLINPDTTGFDSTPLGGDLVHLWGTGGITNAIEQTFVTEAGKQYQVVFAASGNWESNADVKTLRVSADSQSTDEVFSTPPNNWSISNILWDQRSFSFTANDTSATLVFEDRSFGANRGTLIADVQIFEIPVAISTILSSDPSLNYDAGTGKFYKVVSVGADVVTATNNANNEYINGIGGQLATIRSQYENDLVHSLIQSAGANAYYLGGTDATTDGQWNWIEGGQEADRFWNGNVGGSAPAGAYAPFSGEPGGGTGENYLLIRSVDGVWLDVNGAGNNGYVIEWDASEVLSGYTFSLQDDANGRFAIDSLTGEITVSDGTLIDYEAAPIHNITVETTDSNGLVYSKILTIDVDQAVELDSTPNNLSSGIELNTDTGNDAYLIADNGNAVFGGLSSFTAEISFALEDSSKATLFSYRTPTDTAGNDDAFRLQLMQTGEIRAAVNGIILKTTGFDFHQITNDKPHTLSFTWDNRHGDWTMLVDGKLVGSGVEAATAGQTIRTGGTLIFGHEQDAVAGGFGTGNVFDGTIYDIRVWNKVRTEAEIALTYQHKYDINSPPASLIANWQMDDFDVSNQVVDVIGSNNLSIGHVTGTGFKPNTPVKDLNINENSVNGSSVGFVVPSHPDSPYNIIEDGSFRYAGATNLQTINAGQTIGGAGGSWLVTAGSTDLEGSFEKSPLGGTALSLNGATASTIEQTITTEPGRLYQVAFAIAGHFPVDNPAVEVTVSSASVPVQYSVEYASDWSQTNLLWGQRSYNFIASDNTTTLQFKSLSDTGGTGPLIGDVQVVQLSQSISTILNNDPTLSYNINTGKFYRSVTAAVDWDTANAASQNDVVNGVAGKLVQIESTYENSLIQEYATTLGGSSWLGGSDADTEGTWNWSDGSTFYTGAASVNSVYNNFSALEPSGDGNHLEMDASTGNWNDISGTFSKAYIVQWDASEVLSGSTFDLTNDAGGRFAIDSDTGEITVANGSLLDFESSTSHNITVEVTDANDQTYSEIMSIVINDTFEIDQSVPGTQNISEDTVLTFSTATANAVTVSDTVATTNSSLRTDLTVANGILNLSGLAGITIVSGADGSSTLSIAGNETDINAALEGMTFTPDANYNGTVNLVVTTELATNVQGLYTFDTNDASDSSEGGQHNGTLIGNASTVTDATRGTVLSLDGAGDYAQIPHDFGSPNSVTIGGWVNLEPGAARSEFISIDDRVYIALDDPADGVKSSFQTGPGSWIDIPSNEYIAGTGWRHVMYSADTTSGTHTLYIDGREVACVKDANAIYWTGATTTYIGQHPTNGFSLDGMADDVRIYTQALNAQEVIAHANDTLAVTDNVPIIVDSVNDSPAVLTNTGAGTTIGGTVAITAAALNEDDPDDSGSELDYIITNTSNGQLEFAGNPGVAITTSFTQADINSGSVVFIHDGSTGANGSFDFELTDGGEDGAGVAAGTFVISIGGATSDAYTTDEDSDLNVAAPGLLANDGQGGSLLGGNTVVGFDATTDTDGNATWTSNIGNVNLALSGVTYTNNPDNPIPGINAAFDFTGTGSSASAAALDSYPEVNGTQDGTLETWIYFDTLLGTNMIFDTGTSGSTGISLLASGNQIVLAVANSGSLQTFYGNGVLATNTWHHIAVVVDKKTGTDRTSLYVDGALVSAIDKEISNWAPGPFGLGSTNGSTAGGYNGDLAGQIAYFRVHDQALNSATVSNHAANPGAGSVSPFLDSIDLTGTTGTVTAFAAGNFDYSPNGQFEHLGTGQTAIDTFEYIYDDGLGNQETVTATITITGVNDAPVLSAIEPGPISYTEDGSAALITSTLAISDVDDANIESAQISITSNYAPGEDVLTFAGQPGITGSYAGGVLNLSGTATRAIYEAAIRSVTYTNNSDTPSELPRTIAIVVNDGETNSNPATRTLNVTASNDAPTLSTIEAAPVFYTENGSPIGITGNLAVGDVDDTNIVKATVSISNNFASGEDFLAFNNQPGISATYVPSTGVLTLTGSAPLADYEAAIQTVGYFNNSHDPSDLDRTVSFEVEDGDTNSNTLSRVIKFTAVNDAPQLSTIEAQPAFYTENGAPIAVTGNLSITDLDDSDIESAEITISGNFTSGEDELIYVNQLGISGNFDTGTGILSLTGSASLTDYEAAIHSIRYLNTSDDPSPANRTISFTVNDGDTDSLPLSRDIDFTVVNDAPVVTSVETTPATYIENTAPITISDTVTVTDPDNATLDSARVSITGNFTAGEDLLGFVTQNGITGSYDNTTGVLTLGGTSSVANYQAALRSVTFDNNSETPVTLTRTVEFVANDGALDSTTVSRDINFFGVADLAITSPAAVVINEDTSIAFTGGDIVQIDDGTTTNSQVQVSLSVTNGVLTLPSLAGLTLVQGTNGSTGFTIQGTESDINTALGAMSYTPDSDYNGPDILDIRLSYAADEQAHYTFDGGTASDQSASAMSYDGTFIGDATTIIDPIRGEVLSLDGDGDYVRSSDPHTVSQSVTMATWVNVSGIDTDGATYVEAGGYGIWTAQASTYSGGVQAFISTGGGTYQTIGTTESIVGTGWRHLAMTHDSSTQILSLYLDGQLIAQQGTTGSIIGNWPIHVGGHSVRDRDTTGLIDDTRIYNRALSIDEILALAGDASETTGDVSITVLPVNDAPTLATIENTPLSYTENDAPASITGTLSIGDIDDTQIENATVTISNNYVSTEDVLTFTSQFGITGSFVSATGTLNLSGQALLSEYETVLRSVAYENTSDNPSTTTRSVSFTVNDGDINSNQQTRNIELTAVNDAPVLSTIEAAPAFYTENNTPIGITGNLAVNDSDDTDIESAAVSISNNFAVGEDELLFIDQLGITGNFNSTTGVLILTGTAPLADYETAIHTIAYHNTSDNPSPLNRTISFVVNDGDINSNQLSRDIDFTVVNDAPIVASVETAPANYIENTAPITISNTVSVTDPDNATLDSARISITGNFNSSEDMLGFVNQNGIIGSYDNTTGVLMLGGTSSTTNYQAALRSITYENTSDTPVTLPRTVEFLVNDGALDSTTVNRNIEIINVADLDITAPAAIVINEDTSIAFTGGDIIQIDDGLSTNNLVQVTFDVANGALTLSSFTGVTLVQGSNGSSGFTIQGAESDVNAALSSMSYAPDPNYNGADNLNLQLSFATDEEAYYTFEGGNALDQSASAISHDGVFIGNATTTIDATRGEVLSVDGDGDFIQVPTTFGSPGSITMATWVNVTGIDTGGGTYVEGAGFGIWTAPFGPYNGGIQTFINIGTEFQSIGTTENIIGTGWRHLATTHDSSSQTLSLYLDGELVAQRLTSGPNVGAGLLHIGGHNSLDRDVTGLIDDTRVYTRALSNEEIATLAKDANNTSENVPITVLPVNDAPVLATIEAAPVFYTENNPATGITGNLSVSDIDDTLIDSATITISNNFISGEDVLTFTSQFGITGSFDSSTGTLNLSGQALLSEYETVLHSVAYHNTSDNPSTLTRSVSFVVSDGDIDSNQLSRNVEITAVNDAPVLSTIETAPAFYTENGLPIGITGNLAVSDIDDTNIESATVSISNNFAIGEDELLFVNQLGITGNFNAATGVLTLTGSAPLADYETAIHSIRYQNTSDNPSTLDRTVSYVLNDGNANSNTLSRDIDFTAVNDAPVLATIETAPAFYIENGSPIGITGNLALSDIDDTNIESATIAITGNFANGEDELLFVNQLGISGNYNATSGILSLTGTATLADYEAAIHSISYQNTSDNPSTLVRTVSFTVNDGNLDSNQLSRNIELIAVNDAPVLSTIETAPALYIENGLPIGITGNLAISDIDDANIESATVSISNNFAAGEDYLLFTNQLGISGIFDSTSGILTLVGSATLAEYETAIHSVTYENTSDNPSTLDRTITFEVNDGDCLPLKVLRRSIRKMTPLLELRVILQSMISTIRILNRQLFQSAAILPQEKTC